MQHEGVEEVGILGEQGSRKGFHMQAEDGAQAEALVGIAPEGFHHFREAACHFACIVHFIQIAHDGDFHTAYYGEITAAYILKD